MALYIHNETLNLLSLELSMLCIITCEFRFIFDAQHMKINTDLHGFKLEARVRAPHEGCAAIGGAPQGL